MLSGMMVGMEASHWAKLGQAVRDRRTKLHMTQEDVARAGGPSDFTMSKIEAGGENIYRARTVAALERVLRWAPGAVQAILAGQSPADWELPLFDDEPPGALVSEWVPDVTSAGLGFLDLLDKHYGTDEDAAALRRSVILFVKKINEGVS